MTARTISSVLREVRTTLLKAGLSEADSRLEGELLLRNVLGWDAVRLYTSFRDEISEDALSRLRDPIVRRAMREPLAYIIGHCDFFNRKFQIDKRALIPRPETELLVERAIAMSNQHKGESLRIADIGTGSGILAITLALELPQSEIVAVDTSVEALELAKSNGILHGVSDRIDWIIGFLTKPLTEQYNVVVANLPYVLSANLANLEPEIGFEPLDALDGGPCGMRYIEPMIQDLPERMIPNGVALLEIDPPVAAPAKKAAMATFPGGKTTVLTDFGGQARCLEIVNNQM